MWTLKNSLPYFTNNLKNWQIVKAGSLHDWSIEKNFSTNLGWKEEVFWNFEFNLGWKWLTFIAFTMLVIQFHP